MGMWIVAPSILAVWDKTAKEPLETRQKEVSAAALHILRGGARWLHVDIMDGVYVPALTYGPEVVSLLRDAIEKAQLPYPITLDIHLMVDKPEEQLEEVLSAVGLETTRSQDTEIQANVSFHPSASHDVWGCLRKISAAGAVAGLALNVGEEVELLEPFLPDLGFVTVMTVPAGAGGQPFDQALLGKIGAVREMVGEALPIIADGGIKAAEAAACRLAGASGVVAGSFIFNAPEPVVALEELQATA